MMKKLLGLWLGVLIASHMASAQQSNNGGVLTTSSSDCATDGSCVLLFPLPASTRYIVVTTSGTFVADLRFEASYDNGLSYRPTYGVAIGATTPLALRPVNGAVAAGSWLIEATGVTRLRVRCNQVINGYGNVLLQAVP